MYFGICYSILCTTTCEIKLTTARRKLLAEKSVVKKPIQKVVIYKMSLTNSGLLVKKYKDKHNVTYGIPLIVATKHLMNNIQA